MNYSIQQQIHTLLPILHLEIKKRITYKLVMTLIRNFNLPKFQSIRNHPKKKILPSPVLQIRLSNN